MDIDIERRVNDAIERLRAYSVKEVDFAQMDPVAKMMLVALINECQKIQDYVDGTSQRLLERFCSDFVPYEKIKAIPAITLLNPKFKPKKDLSIVNVGTGAAFTYTYQSDDLKQSLNYIPLLNTSLLPYSDLFVLTPNRLSFSTGSRVVSMGEANVMWIGIVTKVDIESLQGLSVLIKGTSGIMPEHIYVGAENKEVDFSSVCNMENIEMAEPFDAQQASGQFFSFVNVWKQCLSNMEDAALFYITDGIRDRDLFKPRAYPRMFQQWLESEVLDCFDANTLWLQLEFPKGFVVPDSCDVVVNVMPVVNVDVNSLTLTHTSPIAKLQKQDDSYFLKIIETSSSAQKQGFDRLSDEVIIRDFDATCYHNGDLYRDVRNLYNKFTDDYYAFIEYNGIKDGEVLKQLREAINKLRKSVGDKNARFKFDSGTYVMKNINQYPPTTATKVSYMSTMGRIGNAPQVGESMENKKLPAIEQKVTVVVGGMGGADKASADEQYEQLRYFALTNDRLYTKMDIDAFLRKEILAEFGKSEFKRIFIRISIEGAGGQMSLQRGLYIDIEFKDKKNYEKAISCSFDKLMKQKISMKSCIAMPINVKLKSLEE